MTRRRTGTQLRFIFALATLACAARIAAAGAGDAATSPDQVLQSKGLTKVGVCYVLDADAKLPESLRTLRKAEKQLEDYARRRREIERDIERVAGQIIQWNREINTLDNQLSKVPQSDPNKYNAVVAQINQRNTWIKEAEQYGKKRSDDLGKLSAPGGHVSLTMDLAAKMDAAAAEYDKLAGDAEVKAAIDKLNAKGGPKLRLGPSAQFKTELPQIRRKRDVLEAAALKMDTSHGVGILNVTLNGTMTTPMVVDSGASFVSITSEVAQQIGLKLDDKSPTAEMTIADGSKVKARVGLIASVKVGKFVAQDVLCVVLPDSVKKADCLLGGSFLKNFVYQIDLTAGELHLSPITASSVGDTTPTESSPTSAPSTNPSKESQAPAAAPREAIEIELAADIDGTDELLITASGLKWMHGEWQWPTNVRVNGTAWDPQKKGTMAVRDVLGNAMTDVEWLDVEVVERTGRGTVAVEPQSDGVLVRFADGANGAGHYLLKLRIPRAKSR